jgi:hypothetical protein
MLGHTFLKLHLTPPDSADGGLLDYGAGFAALTTDSVGLMYFLKGLTGGYKGVFTMEPYYAHVMNYAYGENRDLWEYELPLSNSELDFFLHHFWELYATANVDYFFLDDNCSKLILEALDVVRPELNLTENLAVLVMPHQTVKIVAEALPPRAIRYVPAQRHIFEYSVRNFTSDQKQKLQDLIQQSKVPESVTDRDVLDALLAYLTVEKTAKSDQSTLRQLEEKALIARAKLGQASPRPNIPLPNTRPDRAHPAKKLTLGLSTSHDYLFQWRYGLHSLLDPEPGFDPYYHLEVFNFSFMRSRTKKTTAQLTVAEAQALNPVTSYNHPISWRAMGGVKTGAIYGSGGVGFAVELVRGKILLFSLPGISLETTNQTADRLFPSFDFDVSSRFRLSPNHISLWRWQRRFYPNFAPEKTHTFVSLEHCYNWAEQYSLTLYGRYLFSDQSSSFASAEKSFASTDATSLELRLGYFY